MNTPYVSDKPFPNSYYVASVAVDGWVEQESMFFSTLQQAIAFKQAVEKEYKDETFIVVDTAAEMC
jgi:hypothetical protein